MARCFHRIIKGFMIQGGDAKGTGAGEPGYVIPDELWEGAAHDRAVSSAWPTAGPTPTARNSSITDAAAPHLDRSYTIFGECTPEDMVHKIASVEMAGGDKPKTPPKIKSIKIPPRRQVRVRSKAWTRLARPAFLAGSHSLAAAPPRRAPLRARVVGPTRMPR